MNTILPNVYFNKNNIDTLSSQAIVYSSFSRSMVLKNAIVLINSYFSSFKQRTLISKPTFSFTSQQVTVHFFYYLPTVSELNSSSICALSKCLSQLFNRKVCIKLTRVYYPYMNSHILAQYLIHNAPSNTFINFQDIILTYPSRNNSNLLSHISGIKIELSGRLITERVIPRISKKTSLVGNFQKGKDTMIDYSKFTSKNELGAFTLKI